MLFKLSNLNSNLALTLGYLNPALNNSAQEFTQKTLSHLPWWNTRIVHGYKVRWNPMTPPKLPGDAPIPKQQKTVIIKKTLC